jgi:hypothetical protein
MSIKSAPVLVIFLFIGLGAGYLLFDSSSEVSVLQEELVEMIEGYESLSDLYRNMENNYTELYEEYIRLESDNVHKSEYEDLDNLYTEQIEFNIEMVTELSDLQLQYESLTNNYTNVAEQLNSALTESMRANTPQTSYAITDDLEISLSLERTIYNNTHALVGRVSINHTNGEPFAGAFKLKMHIIDNPGVSGSATFSESIGSDGSFALFDAFHWGPGSYTLQLDTVYDTDQVSVLTSKDLETTLITIEVK